MEVDQELIDAAIAQALQRFPEGYAGAAAAYTSDGDILTSVCLDTPNEIANLCHETGAICEANRRGVQIIAIACVSRAEGDSDFVILPPCGICQERLMLWGDGVQAAVPDPGSASGWVSKTLRKLQPHHWTYGLDDS